MKIITISGLSGSRKTKLAYELKRKIKYSKVISLDNYSYSEEYLNSTRKNSKLVIEQKEKCLININNNKLENNFRGYTRFNQ